MLFLDSKVTDISGLQLSLGRWEFFEYVATGVVFLGVLGELLAEFTDLFKTRNDDVRKKIFTVAFTVVLLIGLAGELAALIRTSTLTGKITQALRNDITEAYETAGKATVEASHANERAGIANQSASQANERAARANERAAALAKQNTQLRSEFEKTTAQGQIKQEELRQQNLATEAKLSAAEAKLESERKTRLELEQSMAPRILGLQIGPGDKTTFDELRPFAGTSVLFEILTDAEARRAGQEIQNVLMFAGWRIAKVDYTADIFAGFYDGVIVEDPGSFRAIGLNPADKEFSQKVAEQERSRKCAMALVSYLLSKGWKARTQSLPGDQPPAGTIKVIVGFKPNPFYDPDWVKEMEERYKKIMREIGDREKTIRKPPNR